MPREAKYVFAAIFALVGVAILALTVTHVLTNGGYVFVAVFVGMGAWALTWRQR